MRSRLRPLITAVLVAALASAWTPATAFENESFGITPFPERTSGSDRSSFSIPLETGATFEDAVRVYNLTDEPLRLALYATDASTALDDKITVGLREEHPEGVGRWIDLAIKSIELEPRDAKTVTFRVKVRGSDPDPDLGAIVVENTDRGLSSGSVQRLHVLVRTVPPNTQTSSKRVRTMLLQSPWAAIGLVGLVVAGALVWIGVRRTRRPRDLVVQPGALNGETELPAEPAPRPALRRLASPAADAGAKTSVLDRVRASAGAARRRDERPLLDDVMLVEVDEEGVRPVRDPANSQEVAELPRERSAGAVSENARPAQSSRPARERTGAESARARRPKPEPATAKPSAGRGAARKTSAPSPARSAKPAESAAAKARSKPKAKAKAKAKAKPRPAAGKARAGKTAKQKPARKQKPTEQNFIPLKDL